MGANRLLRQGAARRAMQRIGQAPQRRRGADLPLLRPGSFAPWLGAECAVMLAHHKLFATTPGRKIIPVKWFLSTKYRSRPGPRTWWPYGPLELKG